jgi:diguanylate cyclase (GGDEF)-like protein
MTNDFSVLIVDDEKTNVEYVSKILNESYKIKVAYNGKQALTIVKNIQIDLILLDIKMPVMDGYEVIRKLKEDSKTSEIPIIFLTSSKDNNTLLKVFELGAHDYITKPFNKEELKIRVANHLSRYHLQKETQQQQELLNMLINSQSYMILLVDSKSVKYINNFTLDFLNLKTLESFRAKYSCICDIFRNDDAYFHLGKVPEDEYWVDAINKLPSEKQIVSIYSAKQKTNKTFKLNIDYLSNTNVYILTFLDISETISKQFELEYKSCHDPLTKSYNREYFQQNYNSIINSYKANNEQTSIAMIDIDHFKLVNDTHGHDVGDEVLKRLVCVIKENSRHNDTVVRWGGEEFIIIMSTKNIQALEKTLQNICDLIRITEFEVCKNITISIGASMYKENEMIEETIKRADEALYSSKRNGRDQVVIV